MKTITQAIRVCLAVIFMMAASTHAHAQSITHVPSAPCGSTVVYSAYPGNIKNPSYYWTVHFSSGGAYSGGGPSLVVFLPNTSGTASVTVAISGYIEEIIRVYNPQTRQYENQVRRTQVTSHRSTSTRIGGAIPSTPSTLSGPGKVCGNNSTHTYTVSAVSGAGSYHWKVSPPYKIVHPTNSNVLLTEYTGPQRSIQVRFPSSGSVSNGHLKVAAISSGNCPSKGAYRTRTIVFGPITPPVSGPSSMARTTVGRFTVNGLGLSNFNWSSPNGLSPISQTNSNSIVLEALSATSGYVTATYRTCGVTRSSSRYVTVSGSSGGGGGGSGFGNPARPALQDAVDLPTLGLYPNPASEVVTLTSERPLEQIKVVNMMGQVVKSLDHVSGNTATLKLTDLKPGTYFVISFDSEGKHTQQLIVE